MTPGGAARQSHRELASLSSRHAPAAVRRSTDSPFPSLQSVYGFLKS